MDQTLQEYLGINWPARSKKPRKDGITMVMDTGWPTSFCESMLAQYGEYLDVVKLWDPHLRAPEKEIRRKIEVYNHHSVKVQPGGIFMEIARIQGRESQVMKKMANLGFSVIEVSSTATSAERDMRRESDFVKQARDLGFAVFGEVGKKFIEGDTTRRSEKVVDEEVTVKEMLALLNAGASYVYWEGHLLRRVMGETAEELLESRESGTAQVQREGSRTRSHHLRSVAAA
jgi:phosphosulfolactate synthase